MIKSIQMELVKAPNEDFALVLKSCKKVLEPKGTLEINSTPKVLPVPRGSTGASEKDSVSEEEAKSNAPIVKMLRQAGFSGQISMTQSAHLGSVRTHVIATA
ncbi:MAG: hypothetical protein ACYCQJ_05330 [Nitrososphaerales archaeon]